MPLIRTVEGGKLLSDLDPRSAGVKNCTRRVNIRRDDDAEILMPGWKAFGDDLPGVVHIHRATRPNGDRAVLAFTQTAIYRKVGDSWTLLKDGFSSSRDWEAEDIDGYVVVNNGIDLPHIWDWTTLEPIYEMREQGIARCGTMFAAYDFLIFADVTDIIATELKDWMSREDVDPYGPDLPGSILTNTPFRVLWTSRPKEWGISLRARLQAGSNEMILDFPAKSLKAGDTVNFIETEPDDDSVTAQFTEVEIEEVDGVRVYLKGKIAAVNSTGILTRSNIASLIIGYDDLQGDGSTIIKMGMLAGNLVAFRESAILLGRLSNSAQAPFSFQEAYRGLAAPTAKKLIVAMGQRSLFYYSRDGWFEFNLNSAKPQRLEPFEVNGELFTGLDEESSFAVHVSPDQEIWIFLSDRTVVYDYQSQVIGEVDSVFSAAAIVDGGTGSSRILVLADDDRVNELDPETFTRNGEAYIGTLEYGWIGDPGGDMRDTLLRRYIPQGVGQVLFSLDSIRSGSETFRSILGDRPLGLGIAVHFYARGQWFRETLKIDDGETRLIGRELDYYTSHNRVRGYGAS